MGHRRRDASESRFDAYVEGLVSVIGHADRARPLRDYCMGLMISRTESESRGTTCIRIS